MEETTMASLEDQIFEQHYSYYKKIGIETIKQQAGQVEQVSSDYQGRVIYELLQNAFDKADKNILVMVKGNSLYVANDGEKFSYVAGFDYERGQSKRGDFQSLCSISTSTKIADTSIGNKGVGFKSVFSISESGFVYVFTQGVILQGDNKIPEIISFRVHDSFKKMEEIPLDFEIGLQKAISEKLSLVQQERNDRGIPGYYFPFHITSEEDEIIELFEKGFVTIVKIPFKDKDAIKELFEEIKHLHFEFIQLKQEKNFEIEFCFDDDRHVQYVNKGSSKLFSAVLDNDEIRELARNAEINIEHPQVAFFLRETDNGYIYNYLPTKVKSPFKYVDFHADFHTTVDRKSINFDGEIGKYNNALYKACIELYFHVLNSYLDIPIGLNFNYIDKNNIGFHLNEFQWNLIEVHDVSSVYYHVTQTLNISEWDYNLASTFLANIAKKYFNQNREPADYYTFHENVCYFIDSFTDDYKKQYKRSGIFKTVVGAKLIELHAKVIPGIELNDDIEVVFRKKSEKGDLTISLPSFLGINITDFEIEDVAFRRALKIKESSDYNELLKYFKQCSFNGKYNEEQLTETQQIELIRSLYQIYAARNERSFLASHRFTKAWNTRLRDANSTLNQACFNISTVFFKTIGNKYKPAQLCLESELDSEFLKSAIPSENREDFLRYLGISTYANYLFADIRLYTAINDGLDFIPALIDRKEENIDADLVGNIYIISSKGKLVHPAVVNDNNYSFLENISPQQIKAELENLLVKRYNDFPSSFSQILKDRLDQKLSYKNDLIRLYQSIFHLFERSSQFLIVESGQLSWTTTIDFIILNTKSDFDLITSLKLGRTLCYYSGSEIPEYLKPRIIMPKKGKINAAYYGKNDELKASLEQRMIFLLISVSHSKNSEKRYLEDDVDLSEIQKKLDILEVHEVTNMEQEIIFNDKSIYTPKEFAIDETIPGRIYLKYDAADIVKADCLSLYLFNNSSLKELVELIVFLKDPPTLLKGIDGSEFETMKKKWKADYSRKIKQFENEILASFGYAEKEYEYWNIYNNKQKSELLIELDRQGRLNELKHLVNSLKLRPDFDGYFDNFEIEIDRSEIEKIAGRLISYLEKDGVVSDNEMHSQIQALSLKLGSEEALKSIEIALEEKFPGYSEFVSPMLEQLTKSISIESRIHEIFGKLGKSSAKEIAIISSIGSGVTTLGIIANPKKIIFQQGAPGEDQGKSLIAIGATGEEEVLIYYINEFIRLSPEERTKGVNAVYEEIRLKTGNDSLKRFKNKCLEVIEQDDDLKKALIPLFYITMHYKYSYFDLIAYKNNNPVLVEVKTTNGANNNRFFLSIAEVNAARTNENYEIVRVAPDSITFMGNPIKSMEEKIELVKGEKFSLIPRNYEFRFNESD